MENKSKNPDEARQTYIIRQSQMERALEYYKFIGVKPTLLELVSTAELMKNYILEGTTPDVKTHIKKFDNYVESKFDEYNIKDIPEKN